jgi:major membrane immunogen (membrane-anchored lipoprotein)
LQERRVNNAGAGEREPVKNGGLNLREHVIQAAEKEGKIPGCPSLTGSRQYSQVPRGEVAEMEESMKRKSMIVAVLMASMLLGACGKQAETNGEKDPVVTEAPTEEATLEAEEPAGNDTKTEESAEVTKGATDNSAATGKTNNTDSSVKPESTDIKEEKSVETESQEKATPEVDVSNYLSDYKSLKSLLNMESTTSWQFGTSDSYVSNNFYLEWDKDIYSMRNDGNPSVKVYGISIGDGLEQAGKTLTANGWKDCETEGGGLFITIIGGNKYCLEFGIDGNGNVSNWYLNNWPEGDIIDYYDLLEQ